MFEFQMWSANCSDSAILLENLELTAVGGKAYTNFKVQCIIPEMPAKTGAHIEVQEKV